jgi:PAS domain S-box-containing protein
MNGRNSIMSDSSTPSSLQPNKELQALYDGSAEGILVAEIRSKRFVRANRMICRMLGYSETELLSLSVGDIHPADKLPHVIELFKAMSLRCLKRARDIPCLRRDGVVIYADIATSRIALNDEPCLLAFFHDITEQKRAMEALRASEDRYRLIADNVADVIWTTEFSPSALERAANGADVATAVDAILDQWRFSFVSPAVERLLHYTADDVATNSVRDILTPASLARVRESLIDLFSQSLAGSADVSRQRVLELEFLVKGGASRWCEVATTYLHDDRGIPTGAMGITRDATQRRQAEKALRESESKLRSLFENLPDLVLLIDRDAHIISGLLSRICG